ncbi:heparin lyase I family protein [Streptomyces sp. ODS28]|uniref:heparin lyase I family protein n=1 Tax=Streptomyces sp. ODS28 TaxID=3136688 RepID=UPI0031ED837F
MRLRKRTALPAAALTCAVALTVSNQAGAAPVWDGDAGQGTGVFASTLCDDPGSVTAQDNHDGRGKVFKFNKPRGLKRCEGHGSRVDGSPYAFRNNATYYVGWDTRTNTDDAGTIFQWKSWGTNDENQQNYPVLMKVEGGELKLFHVEPGEKWTLQWSTPVRKDTWKRIVLGIHTSQSADEGRVELYYNGAKKADFHGRTWDDKGNVPRWGSYGAEVQDQPVINWVDGLRIGTTYGDAK